MAGGQLRSPIVAATRRPQLVKGFMQLFSVEQKRSQALEAHAAAFSTLKARAYTLAPSAVLWGSSSTPDTH